MTLMAMWLFVGDARAQLNAASLPIGARVRVLLAADTTGAATNPNDLPPGHFLIGTVSEVHDDTLQLTHKHHQSTAIPLARIVRLDLSRNRRSQSLRGVVVGFVAGLVAGVLYGSNNYSSIDPGNGLPPDNTIMATAFGAGGAIVGAGLGAVIGGFIHSERWETVAGPGE